MKGKNIVIKIEVFFIRYQYGSSAVINYVFTKIPIENKKDSFYQPYIAYEITETME